MDRARRKTDKKLNEIENQISDIYAHDPALLDVISQYREYCAIIGRQLEPSYNAFMKETDPVEKEKLKKDYTKKMREVTTNSKKYNNLVQKIAKIFSQVNQEALDVVNGEMVDIYTMNYNQVAVDCRKAGIEVDG